MPSAPNRRSRKKAATRTTIRTAALELFLDRGFDDVTTEEIAGQADVSVSTFFRHFPTKDDVVLDELRERGHDLLAAVDAQPASASAGDVIAGAMADWASTRREPALVDAELTLLRTTPSLTTALARMLWGWEQRLADRLAERLDEPVPDFQLRLLAGWTMTTVRVVLWEWVLQGHASNPTDLGEDAFETLLGLPAASRRPDGESPSGTC